MHANLLPMAVWTPSTLQAVLLSVFGLVLVIVGITVAGRASKANYGDTARIGFNVVVAIVIVALGASAIAYAAFGKQILTALGINVST